MAGSNKEVLAGQGRQARRRKDGMVMQIVSSKKEKKNFSPWRPPCPVWGVGNSSRGRVASFAGELGLIEMQFEKAAVRVRAVIGNSWSQQQQRRVQLVQAENS